MWILLWIKWVELSHLRCDLKESNFVFPAVGAGGTLQPGELLTHEMDCGGYEWRRDFQILCNTQLQMGRGTVLVHVRPDRRVVDASKGAVVGCLG